MVILLGVYCVVIVQFKNIFWNFDFAYLKLSASRGFVASLFSPTPDLSVEEDEEEQAAMSNMSIDIDYLE